MEKEKLIFAVRWYSPQTMNNRGFVKAENVEQAVEILRNSLPKNCHLAEIRRVKGKKITPQSITFNF